MEIALSKTLPTYSGGLGMLAGDTLRSAADLGTPLVAFSLASFANREQRAWPGTPVAAARAGLSRSQYLLLCLCAAGTGDDEGSFV